MPFNARGQYYDPPLDQIAGAGPNFHPAKAAAAALDPRSQTVQFWMSKGAPKHVAEGIADRVQVESGFRPTVPGDQGTSIGLYQHHADRKAKLQQLANWQDPMVQHQFAYSEVTGGDATASKHWNEILKAPDRATAAKLWDKYFERSAGSVAGGGGGKSVAGAAMYAGGLGGGVSGDGSDPLAGLGEDEKRAARAAAPATPTPSLPAPADPPEQPAGSPLAAAMRPLSLRPIAVPQPANAAQTYRNAIASIINGRRRPFGSIFG